MHKIFFITFLLFFFTSTTILAQEKNYFQQSLNYTINVELDDAKHILKGDITIDYINNSPDTLTYILMHLWPNAYKNDRTAFSKQMAQLGKTDFYYSEPQKRGNIKNLNFTIDGQTVNMIEYNNWADVMMLELNQPLLPNGTIQIKTPFTVKIPEVFSRLGHEGQNYNITQWYPKPAVYDTKGWHPMPYLEQGEFYSEYGNYNVNVTLPDNYYVASTGVLENSDEIQKIKNRIDYTSKLHVGMDKEAAFYNDTILSSYNKKTLHFKQDKVHDFAWFASKYFLIEKDSVNIDNRYVHSYVFFLPEHYRTWHGQTQVINYTVQRLSKEVGAYPYAHAIAVDGGIKAGSGMEYPCVTVVGGVSSKSMLKTIIIHEIGHNWFYGIFGSNEREHPFMDEGINSFYETKIDSDCNFDNDTLKINDDPATSIVEDELGNKDFYYLQCSRRETQAGNLKAIDYSESNYGAIVYIKNGLALSVLESYLTPQVFDQGMHYYYEQFKFNHPTPIDLQNSLEYVSKKSLSWFFDSLMSSSKNIDLKIKDVKYKDGKTWVTFKNKNKVTLPAYIVAGNNKNSISTKVPLLHDEGSVVLDSLYQHVRIVSPLDYNNKNNFFIKNRLFHKTKITFGKLIPDSKREAHQIRFLPALGYNNYDRFMLGAIITNLNATTPRFQFSLAPMYSFGTKSIVGTGIISQSWFPLNRIKKAELGVLGGRFHTYHSELNIPQSIAIYKDKITPFLELTFNNTPTGKLSDILRFSYYNINEQYFSYAMKTTDSLYRPTINPGYWYGIATIEFTHKNDRTFNPFNYSAYTHFTDKWAKIALQGNLTMNYYMRGKSLNVRGFAGKFFDIYQNTNNSRYYLNTTYSGWNDYLYDDYFIGRNEQRFTSAHQVQIREGGFKIPTPLLANQLGRSNNWLASVNVTSDIPVKLKLPISVKVYADFATFSDAKKINPSGAQGLFNTGISFETPIGNMYLPLYMSKDYSEYFTTSYSKKQRFWQTISFSLAPTIFSRKVKSMRVF